MGAGVVAHTDDAPLEAFLLPAAAFAEFDVPDTIRPDPDASAVWHLTLLAWTSQHSAGKAHGQGDMAKADLAVLSRRISQMKWATG